MNPHFHSFFEQPLGAVGVLGRGEVEVQMTGYRSVVGELNRVGDDRLSLAHKADWSVPCRPETIEYAYRVSVVDP